MHASSGKPMMLSTNATVFTLPTAATGVTPSTVPTHATARIIGHGGSASLPNRPRRWPLWGGLDSKRWFVLRVVSRPPS